MYRYEDIITFGGQATLDSIEEVETAVMSLGQIVEQKPRSLKFAIEDKNLWGLRGTFEELRDCVTSLGTELTFPEPNEAKALTSQVRE